MLAKAPSYARARRRIAAEGFTPRTQTRITLFLSSVKGANMPWLGMATALTAPGNVAPALAGQVFGAAEAMTALAQATEWAPDPMLYWRNVQITAPLFPSPARMVTAPRDRLALDGLALGHALMQVARFGL